MNYLMTTAAIIAAVTFYCALDDAIASMQPEPVDVWHCDGWKGPMYPTEKSMKRAFK